MSAASKAHTRCSPAAHAPAPLADAAAVADARSGAVALSHAAAPLSRAAAPLADAVAIAVAPSLVSS